MISTGFGVPILGVLAVVAGVVLAIMFAVKLFEGLFWVLGNVFGAIGWVVGRVARFVGAMVRDSLRGAGSLAAGAVLVPPTVISLAFGRWSRFDHYRRSIGAEVAAAGACFYRVALGHPLKFVGLGAIVEGVERRVPAVVARAPVTDRPAGGSGAFEGYTIVGSLPTGGSGARLYVAEPQPEKAAELASAGFPSVGQVVIKSFGMHTGPSLPQIVRESRALEAARDLGLVLEHGLDEKRFWYVMPYVPGESLAVVTDRLHAQSGAAGLSTPRLLQVCGFTSDLLLTLERYHQAGLLHKDVKPDNIVVCGPRAYLVDLGLVTPLRSAMTLTTHGTEYFRDPELVRMAMRGAKVNEVDAVRFDLYGVGAVLFSVIEGSFPAHGGLSQITKECPEALKWVVRRAMADLHGRYGSAREMLLDLHTVMAASDPFALKPAELPSLGGQAPKHLPAEPPPFAPVRKPGRRPVISFAAAKAGAEAPPVDLPPAPPVEVVAETARPSRGRGRRRVAAFAATIFLVCGGLATYMYAERSNAAQQYQYAQQDWFARPPAPVAGSKAYVKRAIPNYPETVAEWGSDWKEHLEAFAAEAAVAVSGEHEKWMSGCAESGTEDCADALHFAADSTVFRYDPATYARAPLEGGAVALVLDDFSRFAGGEKRAIVRGVYGALRSADFAVLGDFSDSENEDEIALLAGARNAIGVNDAAVARTKLAEYLASTGQVDGVVWLRKGANPDEPVCDVIGIGEVPSVLLREALGI